MYRNNRILLSLILFFILINPRIMFSFSQHFRQTLVEYGTSDLNSGPQRKWHPLCGIFGKIHPHQRIYIHVRVSLIYQFNHDPKTATKRCVFSSCIYVHIDRHLHIYSTYKIKIHFRLIIKYL